MKKITRTFVFIFGLCFAGLALSQTAATSGNGVPNVDEIRTAAERGDASAQDKLGVMYEEGRGVQKDDTQAVAWYRKAAEQG
jgi:TPR repeat protein